MKKMQKNTEIRNGNCFVAETVEPLVTRLDPDGMQYKFNCDAYVSGKFYRDGTVYLQQAREIIPGKKLGNNVKQWPRLRKALHVAGVKPVNIPGGAYPIHYVDEIVIPDFSHSGTHFFVIKKCDIGKYLEALPLDEAGKARAEEIRRKEAEAEAEAYRQAHDPKCIAKRIGDKLWYEGGHSMNGEFIRVTIIAEDDKKFSVIHPQCNTDLIWGGSVNVPKVLCEDPKSGVKYLSGRTAGKLDPRKHSRIKKFNSVGWRKECAYLMPNPALADEVRSFRRWLSLFDETEVEGVSPELISNAKKIILEAFDLDDNIQKERYVYDRESEKVTKEYLHNWPFDLFGEKEGEEDWRP